jgi:RNA-directed DNA polymerase
MVATGTDVTPALIPPFPIAELVQSQREDIFRKESEETAYRDLLEAGLPPIANVRILSLIIGVSPKLLYAMAHAPAKYYREFTIPKRNGGVRQIATPRVFLKTVQRWILLNILYREGLPAYVTGFVRKKGTLANGRLHQNHEYLSKIDLQDFFPSIGYNKVLGVYKQLGFPDDVAKLLAGLSVLKGRLPQGAPTSPYLANLAFLPCDQKIQARAKSYEITYSRYADDLTFSSDKFIRPEFLNLVRSIVHRAGFTVNRKKTLQSGPGQRLMTTGLVVNAKVHPSRHIRRLLRAKFHQAANHPSRFKKSSHALMGYAAYVHMYDSSLGDEYLKIARTVLELSKS